MVDWTVARQVARLAARSGPPPDTGAAAEVEAVCDRVIDYTRLDASEIPTAHEVTRTEWAHANLELLTAMLDPVAERLDDRLGAAGPFAGALRLGAGVTLAAEVGLVTGYLAQRVLGQYELSLLGAPREPRLLFVSENIAAAIEALDADSEDFTRWIAIHELTHALQFGGVPWLRGHIGGLLREYLATADIEIKRGSAGGLPSLPNPAELVERFREGGLAALAQTREQRDVMMRLQSVMTVVEGHAEHVMDALAPELVPGHVGLREAMDARRRSRSAPERALMRLLGLDMKLRQYAVGKKFCDAVAAEGGIELLNRVWERPESLPDQAELDDPGRWIARLPVAS